MQQPMFENQLDPEEMEAWLAEVELVHEKIKKLSSDQANVKDDDEEIMKMRQKRIEQEKKKEEARRQLQLQKEEEEQKGRKGKGQNKDYANFCKYCCLEYVKQTDKCYWCKRDTLTQEQRYNQLLEKVEKYKEDKSRKQQKKQKFELMEKTEKILWKKSTFTHRKWEYYTSSEEEIESEPIVPKDDPNFKALQLDMEQRNKRKEEDMKKAEELKKKGNDYYSKGDFDQAAWNYSQALELVKDNQTLWLNRAITYIKSNKNKKAINDCTKVIQYADCFENGFTQSRETCCKAFARRALAYYNRDCLFEALSDINQALELIPDDKWVQNLKKEIEAKIDHYERLKQNENNEKDLEEPKQDIQDQQQNSNDVNKFKDKNTVIEENLTYKQIIDKFVGEQDIELLSLFKVLKVDSNEATAYFYEKNGLKQLLKIISKNDQKLHDLQNILASLPALILQIYQEKSLLYQEQFLIQYNGIEVIYQKIGFLLTQVGTKTQSAIYDTIGDYLDVLNLMSEEKPRSILQQHEIIKTKLYPELFHRILSLYKTERDMVATFLSFCSNLSYGQNTPFKNVLFENRNEIIVIVVELFEKVEIKQANIRMMNQLCNLLSNLLTEDKFRLYFLSKDLNSNFFQSYFKFIKAVQFKDNDYNSLKENGIAILVNLTFQINQIQTDFVSKIPSLIPTLIEYLESQPDGLIIERVLTVLTKVNYEDNIFIISKFIKKYSNQSILCLLQWLSGKSLVVINQLKSKQIKLFELLEELKLQLHCDNEINYCNCCNVIGKIIDLLSPINGEVNACSFFNETIPRLLSFVKDKTGNSRKNSAILLAKLTKDQSNLQKLRDLHGMEILQSVMGKL
ncbi:unnamed protein product (macronuclear) [Paramecium tetraurelia]|uniref:Uncharacterized protein n=1 Tax=Paramecium tetraurelia TaxID=5888 RepID=A0C1S1_PARTE|nr:uncharacterized protein GSPATT00034215001 [Paramecium tetraurelia]CAK64738.1 unnamed protein product [Paramecium tetraurelia]|eukprot:XP_001432135.1 hypothetical protein (macronuclear) [Paramecium tetraurelia strain d4-2]